MLQWRHIDVILSCRASLHCRGPTQNDATDGWSVGLPDDMTSGCMMSGDTLGRSYCCRHTSVALNTTCIALYCHSAFPYVARLMTHSLFSSPSHYDLVYRKSWLPRTDVLATERRTYIPYQRSAQRETAYHMCYGRPTCWKLAYAPPLLGLHQSAFQTSVVSWLAYLTIWAVLKQK